MNTSIAQSAEKRYQQRLNMINEMKRTGVSEPTVEREMADARIEYNNSLVEAGLMSGADAKRANAEIIKQKGINDEQRMRRAGVSETTIAGVKQDNEKEYNEILNKKDSMRN